MSVIEKVEKWADLLLDTGKRNNLINFHNTKMSSAEIVFPEVSDLFRRITHAATFEVFDPKLTTDDFDGGDAYEEYAEEEASSDTQANSRSRDEADMSRLSPEQYISLYASRCKRGQILVYTPTGKPLTVLKNIGKKGATAIEETGVNVVYLAFGFVAWKESAESQQVMHAPLLLVPVRIQNESAADSYYVCVTDDDVIINPTFSFKLQNEYGIKLPEYDEEQGIEAYFERVEKIVARLKWSLQRSCKIGIFSFLKINMYQDLKENSAIISQSETVRAMAGEEVSKEGKDPSAKEPPPPLDPLDLHNVVDADSSQAEAIEMVRQGKSFVLQGPPGTGKSQTITNIIAECLYDGKKVLFVSEKLAALKVVFEKLCKVGLGDFCLELHSHKANKKAVIEELCETLKKHPSGVSERVHQELDAKKRAQKQLESYAVCLHSVQPVINKTLYQLYEELSSVRRAPTVEHAISDLARKGDAHIETAENLLSKYADYTASVGSDYHQNAWYGYEPTSLTYEATLQLKEDLRVLLQAIPELMGLGEEMRVSYGQNINCLRFAEDACLLYSLLGKSKFLAAGMLKETVAASALETAKKMQKTAHAILALRSQLDEMYDPEVYDLDASAIYKQLTRRFSGFFSRFFCKEYRAIVSQVRLFKKDGKKPKYKELVGHISLLCEHSLLGRDFQSLEKEVEGLFCGEYEGINSDFLQLLDELNTLLLALSHGLETGTLCSLTGEALSDARATLADCAERYRSVLLKIESAKNRLLAGFNEDVCDLCALTFDKLFDKCSSCANKISELDNWSDFCRLVRHMRQAEVLGFVDRTVELAIAPDAVCAAYKKAFYTQWIDSVLRRLPDMTELSRISHDKTVELFCEKDRLHLEINKAVIRAKMSKMRPSLDMVAPGSELSLLLREGEKKRRQKSVRQLMQEARKLIQTVKPCFLMSPLSVSTFLPSTMRFDVVIFDEASQIFPQDAIGVIYRGQQVVVVGDSKQMPPSNFFNTAVDADSEEDESILDFESILDVCSTSMPQCCLQWHYRSRYEQLISFSNKNFYGNSLITFPSAKADDRGIGVDYEYVDGVFDRVSKTNRAEAERIAELVFEHIEKYPDRSLGVVAFSISQQNLIEKLLYERRRKDLSKEEFFSSDRPEPFFVKNLETVQGDERDTIIFSIAYAKDAQGRLYLNFGPVNRQGGERRLNVAVTRAKINVQLVTSLHYSDIDLARTSSQGARLLREYLDYAENGALALERSVDVNPFEKYDSEFELEVCEFLRENGFSVDTQVGCSSFRIDLALKRPNSSDYVLAIECDGASYHSSRTARDRDRLRQEILEGMGWKFYRIWSTDWFRNNRVEKERLLETVKDVLMAAPTAARKKSKAGGETETFEEPGAEKHFSFPAYRMVDVFSIQKTYHCDVAKIARAVLEEEAPLSEEWFLRRVVHLYGREKVTNVVLDMYERDACRFRNMGIIRRKGFLYLEDKEIPLMRVPSGQVREIKHIAPEEISTGMRVILEQNGSVEKSGLFRLLVQQLGFSRMGEAIVAHLDRALESMPNVHIDANGIVHLKHN